MGEACKWGVKFFMFLQDSFRKEGKSIIIQYQAKYEKDVEYGRRYWKMCAKLSDMSTFGDRKPSHIIFGLD